MITKRKVQNACLIPLHTASTHFSHTLAEWLSLFVYTCIFISPTHSPNGFLSLFIHIYSTSSNLDHFEGWERFCWRLPSSTWRGQTRIVRNQETSRSPFESPPDARESECVRERCVDTWKTVLRLALDTGWRRCIRSLFRKRATNYRALLREIVLRLALDTG